MSAKRSVTKLIAADASHREMNVAAKVRRREYNFSCRNPASFGNPQLHEQRVYCRDIVGHHGCVNALEFSHGSEAFLASGGDDKRVLLWRVPDILSTSKCSAQTDDPIVMRGLHQSNIFCIAFTESDDQVLSSGNDQQVIIQDVETQAPLNVFLLGDACYCLDVQPNSESVFLTSCEDGKLLLFDPRVQPSDEGICIASQRSAFHSAMFNPADPRLIISANSAEGVQLWDIRRNSWPIYSYESSRQKSAMYAKWNSVGSQFVVLRRKSEPMLYDIASKIPLAVFDAVGYSNSCTMKSCCFAGENDEYVVSGSDDFRLYFWQVPNSYGSGSLKYNLADHSLTGHRSIVNQVRYSKVHDLLVSSGVEKIIKMWSMWKLDSMDTETGDSSQQKPRDLYTHSGYISMVLRDDASGRAPVSDADCAEDTRMIAFFDTLVQREMDSSSSEEDSDVDEAGNVQLNGNIEDSQQRDEVYYRSTSDMSDEDMVREPEDESNEDRSAYSTSIASSSAAEDTAFLQNFFRSTNNTGDSRVAGASDTDTSTSVLSDRNNRTRDETDPRQRPCTSSSPTASDNRANSSVLNSDNSNEVEIQPETNRVDIERQEGAMDNDAMETSSDPIIFRRTSNHSQRSRFRSYRISGDSQ